MSENNNPFSPYESRQEWERQLKDESLNGLYVAANGILMLDRRYSMDTEQFRRFGPRTCDMSLAGPEQLAVPGVVTLYYVRKGLLAPKPETPYMGIH